jgi:hypothetical protein
MQGSVEKLQKMCTALVNAVVVNINEDQAFFSDK